jgi:hypothetical protein
MSETSAKNGDRRDELQTSPASNKKIDNRTSSEGIPYFICIDCTGHGERGGSRGRSREAPVLDVLHLEAVRALWVLVRVRDRTQDRTFSLSRVASPLGGMPGNMTLDPIRPAYSGSDSK